MNDFSRALAVKSLRSVLRHHCCVNADNVAMVMSGGTEGGLCPHLLSFERLEVTHVHIGEEEPECDPMTDTPEENKAFAIGTAITPDIMPEDIGTPQQLKSVLDGVLLAMQNAKIERIEDVHFVQVKCPLLTVERIADASLRGKATATNNALKSMGLSRGVAALGVGVALREFSYQEALKAITSGDLSVWSSRASASAGIELMGHGIISVHILCKIKFKELNLPSKVASFYFK